MERLITLMVLLFAFGLTIAAVALEDTAQQTIFIRVLPSTRLSANISDVSITLPSFNIATESESSTLRVSQTNPPVSLSWSSSIPAGRTSKITAQLGTGSRSGIFRAKLARPNSSSAISTDYQSLSTYAVDMLTNIKNESCAGANITYAISPSGTTSLHADEPFTVIWTITESDGLDRSGTSYLSGHYYISEKL